MEMVFELKKKSLTSYVADSGLNGSMRMLGRRWPGRSPLFHWVRALRRRRCRRRTP